MTPKRLIQNIPDDHITGISKERIAEIADIVPNTPRNAIQGLTAALTPKTSQHLTVAGTIASEKANASANAAVESDNFSVPDSTQSNSSKPAELASQASKVISAFSASIREFPRANHDSTALASTVTELEQLEQLLSSTTTNWKAVLERFNVVRKEIEPQLQHLLASCSSFEKEISTFVDPEMEEQFNKLSIQSELSQDSHRLVLELQLNHKISQIDAIRLRPLDPIARQNFKELSDSFFALRLKVEQISQALDDSSLQQPRYDKNSLLEIDRVLKYLRSAAKSHTEKLTTLESQMERLKPFQNLSPQKPRQLTVSHLPIQQVKTQQLLASFSGIKPRIIQCKVQTISTQGNPYQPSVTSNETITQAALKGVALFKDHDAPGVSTSASALQSSVVPAAIQASPLSDISKLGSMSLPKTPATPKLGPIASFKGASQLSTPVAPASSFQPSSISTPLAAFKPAPETTAKVNSVVLDSTNLPVENATLADKVVPSLSSAATAAPSFAPKVSASQLTSAAAFKLAAPLTLPATTVGLKAPITPASSSTPLGGILPTPVSSTDLSSSASIPPFMSKPVIPATNAFQPKVPTLQFSKGLSSNAPSMLPTTAPATSASTTAPATSASTTAPATTSIAAATTALNKPSFGLSTLAASKPASTLPTSVSNSIQPAVSNEAPADSAPSSASNDAVLEVPSLDTISLEADAETSKVATPLSSTAPKLTQATGNTAKFGSALTPAPAAAKGSVFGSNTNTSDQKPTAFAKTTQAISIFQKLQTTPASSSATQASSSPFASQKPATPSVFGTGAATFPKPVQAPAFGNNVVPPTSSAANTGFGQAKPSVFAAASAPSAFGGANQSFGSPIKTTTPASPSVFATSTPAAVGAPKSSIFGKQNAAVTSGTSVFASTPATSTASVFNTASNPSVFGSLPFNASTQAPTNAFGQKANVSPSVFGTGNASAKPASVFGTQQATPSSFGNQGSVFGGQAQPTAFGQKASWNASFGSPPSIGNGSKFPAASGFASSGFAQAAGQGGGFAQVAAQGGGFAQMAAQGTGFGAQANNPTGFGGFAQQANQPSVFGNTAAKPSVFGASPFGGQAQSTYRGDAFSKPRA